MEFMKKANPRHCILVLGMHRSGTSTTSGCMEIAGYDLGQHFFEPEEDNEKGNFENKSITMFNEGLLGLLYGRWHNTYHLPDGWWKDELLTGERDSLSKIFDEEFNENSVLSIKDPRISVLLPFYLDVLKGLNIRPKFIINFRNPFEVAASLEKRNNFTLSKSFLLWMDHTLKAELFTRDYPRVFLDFNTLVKNPVRSMQHLNKSLNLSLTIDKATEKQLNSFVEKGLKHHTFSPDTKKQEIPNMFFQLYSFLLTLNLKVPDKQQLDRFDEFRDMFYSSVNFFAGIDNQQKIKIRIVNIDESIELSELLIKKGEKQFEYKHDAVKETSEFWIYPSNNSGAIHLENLHAKNKDGETLEFNQIECSADWVTNMGWMLFESKMPLVKYKLNQAAQIGKISFYIDIVSFSDFTNMISTQELISQHLNFQKQINNAEGELEKLKVKHNKELKEIGAETRQLIANHLETIARIESKHELEVKQLNSTHSETLNKLEVVKMHLIANHNGETNKLENEKKQLINAHNGEINKLESEQKQLINSHEEKLKKLETERNQLIGKHEELVQKIKKDSQQIISKREESIEKAEVEKNKLTAKINEKADLLDVIFNSGSWKIGRTITKPIRFIKEKTKD